MEQKLMKNCFNLFDRENGIASCSVVFYMEQQQFIFSL